MSIGGGSQKQSSKSQNQSRSAPISPGEVSNYFYGLDALTGGRHRKVGAVTQTSTPAATSPTGLNGYEVTDDGRLRPASGVLVQRGMFQPEDGWVGPGTRIPLTTAPAKQGWSYNDTTYATRAAAEAARARDQAANKSGRLLTWAQQGTTPVDYGGANYAAANWFGVTPGQIQDLGGLGATRGLSADQVYADRAAQIAADPSMTLYQRQYAGGQNTRERQQTRDALAQEAEAAIAQLAAQEAARRTSFSQSEAERRTGFSQSEAQRLYDAAVRNSDQQRLDMQTLGQLYANLVKQRSSSSGTSRGSGSGWNFNVGFGGKRQ